MTCLLPDTQLQDFLRCREKAFPDINDFLHHSLPVSIFLVNKEGYIAWSNKRMLSTLGLSSLEELTGTHVDRWDSKLWTSYKEVIKTKREITLEEKNPYGGYYLTTRKPVIEDSEVIGVLGISVDITQRKRAEQQLIEAKEKAEAANQAKTEFLENIRHDIRTPLGGIVSMALMLRKRETDPTLAKFADKLTNAGHAFLTLIDEIFESVTLSTGLTPRQEKTFSLRKELDAVIQVNQAAAASKQLPLWLDYDNALPDLLIGDPLRIKRLVLELLTNALKFTNQGHVKVSAQLSEQEAQRVLVKISVEDTGIGIPTDKHQVIFTKFTRLTLAYQGKYKGTGLGLANVEKIIEELGGKIELHSQPGRGTTFICTLPMTLSPPASHA